MRSLCLLSHFKPRNTNTADLGLFSLSRHCNRMASFEEKSESDRIKYWNERWEAQQIGFHKPDVHPMLIKHMNKLCHDGKKPNNIFVPLCGKTLDLKWLADQGIVTVGLDGVQTALEQFYSDHKLQWDQTQAPSLGQQGSLLSSKDGMIKLYCGDMMAFSPDIEGKFDAIWDRASIVAINRDDVKRYVEVMKGLVKPGGRILMELLQYDVNLMKDVQGPNKPPPPHPMYEQDIKALYEPEFSVEYVDTDGRKLMDKDITLVMVLLVKQ